MSPIGEIQVHALHNALRRQRVECVVPEGGSIAEIMGTECAPHVIVSLGDIVIPRAMWRHVRPKGGQVITAVALPQGGGGDNNKVLRTTLQLALLVAASYIPGTLGGSTVFAKLAVAGTIIGGNLAINAIVPPQIPNASLPGQLNSLSSAQNQAAPFGPIPRVYGTIRVFPPFASKPYTEVVGNDQFLHLLLCLGYGPLDVTDIKIGETRIAEFTDVSTEVSSAPTLFSNSVDELSFSIEMDDDGDQDLRTSSSVVQELSIDLVFPIGLIYIEGTKEPFPIRVGFDVEYRLVGSSGPWLNAKDSPGLQFSHTSKFNTFFQDYRPHGLYVDDGRINVQDRTQKPFRRSVRWSVPTPGQYDVRLKRVTTEIREGYDWVDGSSIGLNIRVSKVTWTTLRSIRPLNVTLRDDLIYLAVRIKATGQLNGVVDTVNCVCTSRLQVWDGFSFTEQPTSNPAWVLLDVATGAATERRLSTDRFYLDELKDWADRNTAAGREFNAEISTDFGRTTIFELMRNVASVGRASVSMRNGKYAVVEDLEGLPVTQAFTPRNSWGFSAERVFQKVPHALRVRFRNRQSGWAKDEIIVYADGHTENNADLFESYEPRGVTSADQAWAEGRYFLAVAKLRSRTYTINADVEAGIICERGDVVVVAHDVISVGLAQGRLTSVDVTETLIGLDEPVTMEAGKVYGVRLRKSDGSQMVKTVITNAGEQNSLTLAVTEPGLAAGDLFLFGEAGVESVRCKVLRIEALQDLSAKLTLIPEAAGVYQADVGDVPTHTGPDNDNPLAPSPPYVYFQQSDESVLLINSDGSLQTRAVFYYGFRSSSRPNAATVEGQFKTFDSGTWIPVPTVSADAGQVSFLPVEDGFVYDFRLRSVAPDGTPSEWTTIPAYTVIGKTTLPADIESLRRSGDMISWQYPNPPRDFKGFLVRYHIGENQHWESALPVVDGITTDSLFDVDLIAGGTRTVMVKAVDSANFESANAATLILDFGDAIVANLVLSEDYKDSAYPGTITNGAVVGDEIHADSATLLWSGNDSAPLWSDDISSPLWTGSYKELIYQTTFLPRSDAVGTDSTLILEPVVAGVAYMVEFRAKGDEALWGNDDSAPLWSGNDSDLLWDADGEFRPWPGRITGISRQVYEFRLTVAAGASQGVVSSFPFLIDVPDIIERFDDFAIAAGGSRLPITKTYRAIANISLTLQDDGGDARSIKWLDKDYTTGPLIRAFDVSNNGTVATADAIIQGY